MKLTNFVGTPVVEPRAARHSTNATAMASRLDISKVST
jgi:hypothetical protein